MEHAEGWGPRGVNPFPAPENLWTELAGLAARGVGRTGTTVALSDQRHARGAQSHKPPAQPMLPVSSTYFKSVTRQERNTSRSWLSL